jgi:hypothetical protein
VKETGNLMGRSPGKQLLEKQRRRDYNIKVDLGEVGCEDIYRNELAESQVQW